jgi:hypothetical protein
MIMNLPFSCTKNNPTPKQYILSKQAGTSYLACSVTMQQCAYCSCPPQPALQWASTVLYFHLHCIFCSHVYHGIRQELFSAFKLVPFVLIVSCEAFILLLYFICMPSSCHHFFIPSTHYKNCHLSSFHSDETS